MKKRLVPIFACFLSSTLSASVWTLTTADFQTRRVEVVGMTTEAVAVKGAGGATVETVPVASLLSLTHEVAAGTKTGAYQLMLASGDSVAGVPVEIDGETLTWESPAVGKLTVPLKDVRGIGKGSAAVGDGGTVDVLTLGNGDTVKGIVAGMKGGKYSVTVGSDNVEVPVESAASVVFAAAGKSTGNLAHGFRVKLADGSSLTGTSVVMDGQTILLKTSDGVERKLAATSVAALEQVNGPVVYLSSLMPTEDVQRPYLGEAWPTRMDRTVTGQPIRVDGKGEVRGIGVHAYSRLTFALDPSYQEFRTQYAIDGGGAYANVDVRVLLDGKVLYEKKGVTAAKASAVVKLPVGGAKLLALEVDYGLSNDAQDRFVWIEPALVR